jgi:hypothetical protein
MELTKVQNDLLTLLKLSEVSIDAIIGIMIGLKNSEELMIEMILYIADNHPNEAQINEKFVEMAMRPQERPTLNYLGQTPEQHQLWLEEQERKKAYLEKQKPVSREEAIAQIQRIRQASSQTKN